jgi:hypothetical protein
VSTAECGIGRIDNQRRAGAGVLYSQERGVIGAAHIDRGAALLPRIAAVKRSSLLVQFFPLRLGEEFLVRKPGGALQGRIKFVGPNSLKIRFALGRFQRRAGSRRSLRRGRRDGQQCDRHRNGGAYSGRGNAERCFRA